MKSKFYLVVLFICFLSCKEEVDLINIVTANGLNLSLLLLEPDNDSIIAAYSEYHEASNPGSPSDLAGIISIAIDGDATSDDVVYVGNGGNQIIPLNATARPSSGLSWPLVTGPRPVRVQPHTDQALGRFRCPFQPLGEATHLRPIPPHPQDSPQPSISKIIHEPMSVPANGQPGDAFPYC